MVHDFDTAGARSRRRPAATGTQGGRPQPRAAAWIRVPRTSLLRPAIGCGSKRVNHGRVEPERDAAPAATARPARYSAMTGAA